MRTYAHRTTAAVATVAMGLAAVAAGASAATAAPDDETSAYIYVELSGPDGTKELEAVDVLVGDGAELTADDVTSNPDGLDGAVEVDIDLTSFPGEVTVSGASENFTSASLIVELAGGYELGGAEVYYDALFGSEPALWYGGVDDATVYAYWEPEDESQTLDGAAELWIFDTDDFPFIDAPGDESDPDYAEHWLPILYLGSVGISEGWETPEGQEFRPYSRTTRDALAAFLYRVYGEEASVDSTASPFVDVSSDPDSPDYSEHWEAIYWMAEEGLAAGWETDEGQEYRPTEQITRDAVASFFYRIFEASNTPEDDPFVDVSSDPDSAHYSEHAVAIAWMYDVGLTEGWETPSGLKYRPTAPITRDAVAAFIFRATQQL